MEHYPSHTVSIKQIEPGDEVIIVNPEHERHVLLWMWILGVLVFLGLLVLLAWLLCARRRKRQQQQERSEGFDMR